MRRLVQLTFAVLLLAPAVSLTRSTSAPASWPESQRAFYQGGSGLLLSEEQRNELLAMSEEERAAYVEEFLADPDPETTLNELEEAIARRHRLTRQEFLGLVDDRAKVLFLHGEPESRLPIECGQAFRPLEIWSYGADGPGVPLVFYKPPEPSELYRLWLPVETKRVLYTREMTYWLQQWEELRGLIRAKRFDKQACPDTFEVDEATGIDGLRGYRRHRPSNEQLGAVLGPPADLAAWTARAMLTPLPEGPLDLVVDKVEVLYPDRRGQRILTRVLVTMPQDVAFVTAEDLDPPEVQVGVDGVVELHGKVFDQFRLRFKLPPERTAPVALQVERTLRPGDPFVLHLRLRDEIGGAEAYLSLALDVPTEPMPVAAPEVAEEVVVAVGEALSMKRPAGADSLLLVPPETDVVVGLWRAEALITGENIDRVAFLVDDVVQLTRNRPPYTAELRLSNFPTEQVVRVEGYDAEGDLVTSDEVILNQQRGALAVRIVEPARGRAASGATPVRAEVTVPEERRVTGVEFRLNDVVVAELERPPWKAEIEVPASSEIVYLTAVAELDDGSRAEDVRFLNTPEYFDQVEVNLVELYITVTDRSAELVRDLMIEDFEVFEDGRKQQLTKFELVDDLPLTVGFAIDTSGSMVSALPVAKTAALDFLRSVMKPRDRAFALAFSDQPYLLMPPTSDVSALEKTLTGLRSVGWTTLHDAVVTALYYFRGLRGRRALILLSDGDDTASGVPFPDALEYGRRSGVGIYSIGLEVDRFSTGVRRKLSRLSAETGGRVFHIAKPEDLAGVYQQIEAELRSQYLLAYTSDRPGGDGAYRTVEVKVRGGKLKARTTRGYYP
ncbi:MAG: VWA domain-containing protein [Thermoanaerobaculia bacterium]